MAGTFSRAGLMVDQSSKRRLLGVIEIIGTTVFVMSWVVALLPAMYCISSHTLNAPFAGMFNVINSAMANTPDLDAAPAVLPTLFSAKITTHELCGLESAKNFCKYELCHYFVALF